jgi:RecG-like helicase
VPNALAEALAAAGIELIGDLASLVPDGEEVLTPIHGAGRPIPPGRVAIGGRVRRRWSVVRPDGVTSHAIVQGAGPAGLIWEHTPSVLRDTALGALPPDARVVVVGEWSGGALHDPEVVALAAGETSEGDDRRTVRLATYLGVDGRLIRAGVSALAGPLGRLRDPLPADVVAAAKLEAPGEAIAGIHLRGAAGSRRRLAFEEAFLLQLGLSWPRFVGPRERGVAHPLQHALLARLAPAFGLTLSDAEALAFEDVKRDLRRSTPGMRILSGSADVAARLAIHACVLVAESRAQVLVVCPDATSAEERLTRFEPIFREAGLVAKALVGEPSRATREALRRGEIHAVFAGIDTRPDDLEWRRLGLIAAFERPPFGGTLRRLSADARSGRPDLLIVPGETVPWATAIAAWPALDVSAISPRRSPLHVEVAPAAARAGVYARAAARAPRDQVLVTFPQVGGTDAVDLRDAIRLVRALESDGFAGKRIALYHGSMARDERARVAEDVLHHRVDVVVATTRYEEGGPLGGIGAVLVEQAQGEDPARVRQLMGVPRGPASWLALILGDDAAAPAWMAVLSEPRFEVATGGPPVPQLRWAGDDAIGWEARGAAHELLAEDPGLRRSPELARQVRDRWSDWFPAPVEAEAAETEGEDTDDEGGWPCPIPDVPAVAGEKKRRRRRKKKR